MEVTNRHGRILDARCRPVARRASGSRFASKKGLEICARVRFQSRTRSGPNLSWLAGFHSARWRRPVPP